MRSRTPWIFDRRSRLPLHPWIDVEVKTRGYESGVAPSISDAKDRVWTQNQFGPRHPIDVLSIWSTVEIGDVHEIRVDQRVRSGASPIAKRTEHAPNCWAHFPTNMFGLCSTATNKKTSHSQIVCTVAA
mmetsp:Transcript_12946/g.37965  ORF Transcript_12946/g.37965 Transcript_12946/m.37965 type:complete len:129 (-) Transcript_12946:117-503(-)